VFRVQGYKAKTVCDEFIRQDGGIGFDLDKVNRHGGNFGKNSAAEGVGESKVYIAEGEIDAVTGGLDN